MTFKNCIENFPLYDTLVGSYNTDQSFSVPAGKNVDDIEEWRDNPFWEDASCYSFVTFNPDTKKFTVWVFAFWRVSGYINETYDSEEFFPATCSENFGWEIVDPYNYELEDQVIVPDDELAMQFNWPMNEYKKDKWRREQVAYLFDADSYLKGFTFTSAEALKKFVKERKDLL